MITVALIAIIALALLFDYTNGFHDAANAIASAISTRALTPRMALIIAAIANLGGALLSTGVAVTIAKSIIDPPAGPAGMTVVLAALVGAIAWNFITWYFGLPSSSSQALIGGLVGAGLASGSVVHWTTGVVEKVLIPMVLSPTIGLVGGYSLMIIALWVLRKAIPHRVDRGFRIAQIFSATSLALGHGLQDAQKGMGIIVLALVTAGYQQSYTVPIWVVLACAFALAAGTYSGGWRIMRTLGRRIFPFAPCARLRRRDNGLDRAVSHGIRDRGAYFNHSSDEQHSVMESGSTRRLLSGCSGWAVCPRELAWPGSPHLARFACCDSAGLAAYIADRACWAPWVSQPARSVSIVSQLSSSLADPARVCT
jgi:PiT family inorganic phosphate transporter